MDTTRENFNKCLSHFEYIINHYKHHYKKEKISRDAIQVMFLPHGVHYIFSWDRRYLIRHDRLSRDELKFCFAVNDLPFPSKLNRRLLVRELLDNNVSQYYFKAMTYDSVSSNQLVHSSAVACNIQTT